MVEVSAILGCSLWALAGALGGKVAARHLVDGMFHRRRYIWTDATFLFLLRAGLYL